MVRHAGYRQKAAETPPSLSYRVCMTSRAHKLIEEFFALPEDEQAEVLDAIVPADEDPELTAELERRVRSIEDGTAVLLDGDEVLARLQAKYPPQ